MSLHDTHKSQGQMSHTNSLDTISHFVCVLQYCYSDDQGSQRIVRNRFVIPITPL